MIFDHTLYRGKKRQAKRHYWPDKLRLIKWALTIKPGDYIATCEGMNRKVVEIKVVWEDDGWFRRCKPNGTRFIDEVRFTDTNGRWHYCPGGGCAYPAESPQAVHNYLLDFAKHVVSGGMDYWYGSDTIARGKAVNESQKLIEAAEFGLPLVDAYGEILPPYAFQPSPG